MDCALGQDRSFFLSWILPLDVLYQRGARRKTLERLKKKQKSRATAVIHVVQKPNCGTLLSGRRCRSRFVPVDRRTVQIPVEYAEMWAGMVFPFYPSGPRHYAGAVVGSYHILLLLHSLQCALSL